MGGDPTGMKGSTVASKPILSHLWGFTSLSRMYTAQMLLGTFLHCARELAAAISYFYFHPFLTVTSATTYPLPFLSPPLYLSDTRSSILYRLLGLTLVFSTLTVLYLISLKGGTTCFGSWFVVSSLGWPASLIMAPK